MRKSFVATLLCGVMMVQPASAAMVVPAQSPAAPAVLPISAVMPAVAGGRFSTADKSPEVIEVRSRRGYHYHRHRRSRGVGAFGTGVAVGIIGALIAKGITEAAARDRFDRCARDFRSFDYETGTIITRSGEERLCPYLR